VRTSSHQALLPIAVSAGAWKRREKNAGLRLGRIEDQASCALASGTVWPTGGRVRASQSAAEPVWWDDGGAVQTLSQKKPLDAPTLLLLCAAQMGVPIIAEHGLIPSSIEWLQRERRSWLAASGVAKDLGAIMVQPGTLDHFLNSKRTEAIVFEKV
jgi:hypothetical protein